MRWMANTRDSRRLVFASFMALMIAGSVNWTFVGLPFADLAQLRTAVAAVPDRATPEYPQFLLGVRSRTSRGDVIAIAVPRRWRSGYEYAYYRASYFLTGRTVMPLLDENDTAHPERLASVDYVAAWQMQIDAEGFVVVWRGHDGVLARRAR